MAREYFIDVPYDGVMSHKDSRAVGMDEIPSSHRVLDEVTGKNETIQHMSTIVENTSDSPCNSSHYSPREPTLWAVSDLHITFRGNDEVLSHIQSDNPQDWLIVAGDVTENIERLIETLEILQERFATIIWVPGNHELYTTSKDPYQLFGVTRYDYIVEQLRMRGILTPEDPYPVFYSAGEPYRIVPLFLLYDYSFRPHGYKELTVAQALEKARNANIMATDEILITPEPYANKEAWCRARLRYSIQRLDAIDPGEDTVLINHWPLRQEPCDLLFDPEFSLWCGTEHTHDWHLKYHAVCCVYGHLHLPRTTWYDNVRFEEVSIGYAREWKTRGLPEPVLRQILPDPQTTVLDMAMLGLRFKVDPDRAKAARLRHEERRNQLKERARRMVNDQ